MTIKEWWEEGNTRAYFKISIFPEIKPVLPFMHFYSSLLRISSRADNSYHYRHLDIKVWKMAKSPNFELLWISAQFHSYTIKVRGSGGNGSYPNVESKPTRPWFLVRRWWWWWWQGDNREMLSKDGGLKSKTPSGATREDVTTNGLR